jgi:hypothetical protein
MSHGFIYLLLLLFAGHALCDYPLQGDFLAKGKNRWKPIPGVPWYQCLFAHALIHAGMVCLVTGIWWLGILELFIHAVTDYAKCAGWFGSQTYGTEGINPRAFNVDQAIHYGCKLLWAILATRTFWGI